MNIKRLLIIDQCLSDTSRRWTLDDLIDACKSTEKNSKRSLQADLETLRKVYAAPIVVDERKYYKYSDERYSLTKNSLPASDRQHISDALSVVADYLPFKEMKGVDKYLLELYQYLVSVIDMPRICQFTEADTLKPIQVRLWVSYEIADKIRSHPLHQTQRVEQEEIDGSINIVMTIPITRDFENYLIINSHQVRVTSPASLVSHIKKIDSAEKAEY